MAGPVPPLIHPVLAGETIEVSDLASTRAFYTPLFEGFQGEWTAGEKSLAFRSGPQLLEFVERAQPRVSGETGAHIALRVQADRLHPLAEKLEALGRKVNWWLEDHPSERKASVYVHDPSGNRLQLVSGDGNLLLDHAAIEVYDLVLAEAFYTDALGGAVDYYHGLTMDHYAEAKCYDESNLCAPWTRLFVVRVSDKQRMARPNLQLFLRFGETVLGLILAHEHRQEPPEELRKGTPRLLLRTAQTAEAVADHLSRLKIKGMPAGALLFEREGQSIFLRDPSGNFFGVECAPDASGVIRK